MALSAVAWRETRGTRPGYKWWVLSATSLGTVMAVLNATTLLIALPTLIRDLHLTPLLSMWILLGYMVTQTVMLLTVGRLSDLYGRKTFYVAGFAIFTGAALLAGFATNGQLLLMARVLQALGGALVMGNSTALVADAFPREELGLALGINSIVIALGQVAGPILGGVLVTQFNWHWVFWFNVPVGLVGTLWALWQLHPELPSGERQGIDVPGNLVYMAGLLGLLIALTFGGLRGWGEPVVFIAGGAATVGFLAFYRVEKKAKFPLLDFHLFEHRLFAMGNLANLLIALGRGALVFLFIFYFQGARGYNAFQAGVAVIPMAIAMGVVGPISGYLADRFGSRLLASLGALLVGGGLLGLALTLRIETGYPMIAAWLAIVGIGNGLFNSPNTSAVMGSVGPRQRGVAAGTRTMLLNTGNVFSMAFVLAVVAGVLPSATMLAIFAGEPTAVSSEALVTFVAVVRLAFFLMAGVSVVAAVVSYLREPVVRAEVAARLSSRAS